MNPSEDQIQMALLEWLRLHDRRAWELTHHSPNGGARSAVTGARLKALGVRRGFPDLTLWLPRGGFHGLAVELKAGKGRPTPEQLAWINHMASIGWMAAVCTGFDAARETFDHYLKQSEPSHGRQAREVEAGPAADDPAGDHPHGKAPAA